jgi:ABC-type taurine transport system ATPase subunit
MLGRSTYDSDSDQRVVTWVNESALVNGPEQVVESSYRVSPRSLSGGRKQRKGVSHPHDLLQVHPGWLFFDDPIKVGDGRRTPP